MLCDTFCATRFVCAHGLFRTSNGRTSNTARQICCVCATRFARRGLCTRRHALTLLCDTLCATRFVCVHSLSRTINGRTSNTAQQICCVCATRFVRHALCTRRHALTLLCDTLCATRFVYTAYLGQLVGGRQTPRSKCAAFVRHALRDTLCVHGDTLLLCCATRFARHAFCLLYTSPSPRDS